MRAFRTGRFQRDRVGGRLRGFCPNEAVASVVDVDPAALVARGKKLVLLDVDNTLMPWRGEAMPELSLQWIADLKKAGLQLCVLSNTRRAARLRRIGEMLDVPVLRGKFKPSPKMYHLALAQFGVRPDEAVMVGDQLFTDVWGANRAGIEAIWVCPMARREFAGTKLSRLGESIVRGRLYRALEEPTGGEPE